VRAGSIYERKNLVSVEQFGSVPRYTAGVGCFLDSLPDVLAARDLKEVAAAVVHAHRAGRPVAVGMGAHVVKCGLGPTLIDLMKRGIVTSVAMNGAGAIHDYELALIGETSEDVGAGLDQGRFGMARETAAAMQAAAERGAAQGMGLGRALGQQILSERLPHARFSILAAAAQGGLPATVHVAIGTDVVHMHPVVKGADAGEASHLDFRILCSVLRGLERGVWLNIGSAVVIPEVFLKALTVARNLGGKPRRFTAVNMDMIQHYRPRMNVLLRPGAKAYSLLGHHELMLPLLRMAILWKLGHPESS